MVTEAVNFSPGNSGRYRSSSNALMDLVAQTVMGMSSFGKIEVQVSSEGEAGDEKAMATAQGRAEGVVAWMEKEGVEEGRLTAKGVEATASEGDEPAPNLFLIATEKEEITGLKRRYVDAPEEDAGGVGEEKTVEKPAEEPEKTVE